MAHHLIELSFGPVQGFIASARRSRDLWAGSRFLSDVARAAAKQLVEDGAALIYPTPEAVDDEAGSNLSNVVLARIEEGDPAHVAKIAAAAQQAGRDRLRAISDVEKKKWSDSAKELRVSLWDGQVARTLESYAAWAAWDGSDTSYRASYEALKSAFAQRKNTRDFPAAPPLDDADAGLPKSSLDGANESVLPKGGRAGIARRMGIAEGEQLDALGCMKRSFGRQEAFTALTRLAADAWLRDLKATAQDKLNALAEACEPLVEQRLATRCKGNEGIYADFPYDSGLLFGGALEAERQAAERAHDRDAIAALDRLAKVLRSIGSQPNPYMALMVADGDRMGVFVDQARSAADHAAISKAIACFANRVPAIARQFRGHAIFNGGEDLMVAFPLDTVVEGARALSKAFDEAVRDLIARLIDDQARGKNGVPTLRAGVAICHVSEPMGWIRECAERAEKYAKGPAGGPTQGNALGLRLHVRTGHEMSCRLGFGDIAAFAAFAGWVVAYREGALPARVAYEIRSIEALKKKLLPGKPSKEESDGAHAIALTEFERILDRARQSGGKEPIEEGLRAALRSRLEALSSSGEGVEGGFFRLGDELVLARWLSAKTASDLGERAGT